MAEAPKRNARACEACRVSKSRCIYKTEAGICQRCELNGIHCIVRSKARPMRAVSSRAIDVKKREPANFSGCEFSIKLPAVSTPDNDRDLVALQEHHEGIFDEDESSHVPLFESPPKSLLFEKRKVSLQQAEQLLAIFRTKASFFPFVQIPDNATVPSLARSSPFLLLALLTSASMNDLPLYYQLSYEFRRILSTKVIIDGRRSIDYLRGLLIYISWYPIHASPRKNQTFMYMNLAITLVTDLGLDQEQPNLHSFSAVDSEGLIQDGNFTSTAKLAYLGCYYLSAALSRSFQKPNNLHYRELIDIYGQRLMLDGPSTEIFSLLKLHRLEERIGEAYIPIDSMEDAQLGARNAALNLQLFWNELQQWRNMTSDQIKNTVSVALMDRFTEITIYGYCLGFLTRPYRKYLRSPSAQIVDPSHLWGCLTASKVFFEYLLSLPEAAYRSFTVVEWGLVVHAVLILSRLTFILATNMAWDAENTRANIPMLMYLDSLCYRFQQMSSTKQQGDERPKNPDLLFMFKLILESVRKSWEKRVTNISPSYSMADLGQGPASRDYCPILDPSLSSYLERPEWTNDGSLDFNGSTSASSTFTAPLYHDLWATMTGSWAQEC